MPNGKHDPDTLDSGYPKEASRNPEPPDPETCARCGKDVHEHFCPDLEETFSEKES